MKIDIFQVDAFADNMFSGITSAVCPLDRWIDNSLMQQIAERTNLSKTAFVVKQASGLYEVKWFTPNAEITLSDHTPLASAYVIFNYLEKDISQVTLRSMADDIVISKKDNLLSLNFKANMPELHDESNPIFGLSTGIEPLKVLKHTDYILVFENEDIIKSLNPKLQVLKSLDLRGVCFTALGKDSDFVFKYFAPKLGVDEDLVTGSICSQLTPYWSQVLNKTTLKATQFSNKRGKIICQLSDNEVTIKGEASLFMKGEIIIEERKLKREQDGVRSKLAMAI